MKKKHGSLGSISCFRLPTLNYLLPLFEYLFILVMNVLRIFLELAVILSYVFQYFVRLHELLSTLSFEEAYVSFSSFVVF
jgi:hypothetical protein